MDQHGSSGFSDTDSSAGSLGHSQTQPAAAYTSEQPNHIGANSHFYTHPSRTSILSANGGLLLEPIPGLASMATRGGVGDMDHAGLGNVNNGWTGSGGSLPSFSRGFNMFMSPIDADGAEIGADDAFFVPSYLSDSTYVRKLKEAHRSKMQIRTEMKLSSPIGTQSTAPGFPQQPLPAGSHRGMSHNVIERPPPFEEDDSMAPLPSRWNKDDMWGPIEVLPDGREVKYTGSRNPNERDHEASAVRADHYMPPQCGIYYYEVAIKYGKRDDTTIAIGFSAKNVSTARPIGWEPESWGYHGDDGRCFTGQNIGRLFGPTFSMGDIIGCGVNFRDHTAFFTKNGVKIGVAFHDVGRTKLYPAVSLKKPEEHVSVNFGQTPFVFDIDTMMREQREKIRAEIESTDASRLEPGLSETDLIQALVLQFLQHDGYVETARAFAEDIKQQKEALRLDPNVTVDGINIKDDEDANNRQRIRRAILEGDVDRALKLTNAYYPQVFRDNEAVHFKLRCRKFIELVGTAAQLRISGEPKKSNGNGPNGNSNLQDMDVDLNNGSDGMPWNENMTMETETQESQSQLQKLEMEMLQYGQTLGGEYANDPRKEINKALAEIWALVAYPNPLKEPQVSHLLDKNGRVAVAEELNSAILSSLGKSSRASLEKVYAQTSVLLEDLRTDGGPGAFVSVQDVVDSIKTFP
ncbi:hypothetical protein QQS21_008189 [Conoideocrella luteorostrata]|uniref:Protein SSH4 n=1 Tax=Conoideocrella luteorostrata TaxID=1105319 RepID=A0AAJ0FRE2_9HYPO|nr:hypothetical protein QQS21_008189 [Conoideocrella luteorostrata]